MSETPVNHDQVRMARDLREIKRLYGHLRVQAHYAAVSRDAANIDALHLAGPAADLRQWETNYETAEATAIINHLDFDASYGGADYAADQTDEHHPLLILGDWEDRVRKQLGTPTDRRATVHDAATYLTSAMPWMFDTNRQGNPNFIEVQELLKDLSRCRARLENVLKDGIRYERTETPCNENGCGRILVKVYGHNAAADRFRCPAHKIPIDYPTYVGIRHQHMYSAQAENTWIDVSSAAKSINRSQWTIRQWMKPAPRTTVPFHGRKVMSRRVGPMRRIEVYWPNVRDEDAELKRREATRRARTA